MDTILINDLAVAYRVGVTEAERAQPQRLLLTVEMECPFAAAAQGDQLSETIDYYAVCQRLLRFGEGRSWKLLETLAVDMAGMIKVEFRAATVLVLIKKFIISEANYVGVRVVR